MYLLEGYAGGQALVTGDLYRAYIKAEDQLAASSLVADMNRPEVLGKLAAHRFSIETGGIMSSGIPLHTDRESQTTLILTAQQGSDEAWKGSDGKFYPMTALEIQAAADDVIAHKRRCFKAEADVAAKIDVITDHNELAAFDVPAEFDAALALI